MTTRRFSLKFFAFLLAPAVVLVSAAEAMVRVKYFLAHDYEWHYLTTPVVRGPLAMPERWTAPKDQMVFNWRMPCVSGTVFSQELQKEMPRTWDENCFRGDRVMSRKDANEYRIMFVGGSTVEDAQSDVEMMTAQFKRVMPPAHEEKR
jgi:hypothetical protein